MARMRRLVVWTVIVWAAATPARAATVSEWLNSVESAARAAGLLTSELAQRAFDDAKRTLTDAKVLDEELSTFVTRYTRPDVMALAHRSQQRFDADISPAVTTLKRLFTLLPDAAQMTEPLHSIELERQKAENASSMMWDFEILRRLERKYGPGSAKLNGAEVLLAYALQGTKGFGIDSATRYPGPFEPVLAYSVAYLTHSDDSARVVSVAELGLRRYIFKEGWGGGGRLGFIRPRYISAGVGLSGETDEPLSFRGDTRFGAFFGWGEMKVAYLGGANKRVLFTQQFQIIPWVF